MYEEYISPLGDLDHWEDAYEEELNLFHNNNTQTGEVWYGSPLQKRIVAYIKEHFQDKTISILDIGFGNGIFLYKLAKQDYTNLYGMDYAEKSLILAQEILDCKNKKHNKQMKFQLYQEDINDKERKIPIKFDLIHDKGSFDAFMLNRNNKMEDYIEYILSYSKKGETTFIITSGNNTREELKEKFSEDKGFKFIDELKNRTFKFGGQEGQRVATQIYKII